MIVFLTLAYHPVKSGAERHLQMIAERWVKEGQEIAVLTRHVQGYPDHEMLNGVEIFRLRCLWWPGFAWLTFTLNAFWFLFRRRLAITSIWSVMLNVTTGVAVLSGWVLGKPVVCKLSSGGPGGSLRVMERTWFGKFKARWLLSRCHAIIVLNEGMVKELGPYGVDKVWYIPNGVDTDYFRPPTAAERKRARFVWSLNPNDVVTLFVGRMDAQKNLFYLLEAWKLAHKHGGRLVLAGDGPDYWPLRDLAYKLGLSVSVLFPGHQPDMLSLYHAADIFILPSFYEGTSNALLEAMACGLPVIVSRISGNIEIAAKCGSLVDPECPGTWVVPWADLIMDEALRQKHGANSRNEIVQHYTANRVFKDYQRLEESL